RLDGAEGPAAAAARSFAADAERRLGLEVAMWDEWLTTAQAERVLIEGGVRRGDRRSTVDALAATLILQSYLDAHARRPSS
ncbi:MAG: Holliday junction resolvase RuvX, partial [Candidatus Dormiibacterota bacterium]